MATFRFNPAIPFLVFSLACISRESMPEAASAPVQEAKIQKTQIEHVIPQRDFVGRTPTVLEWTKVPGVDTYTVSVENEIEISVFEQEGVVTNSMPWPKGIKVDPGTYFWRIVGLKGEHIVADSGRAAFVVRE
jgi:hypothetical protein